MGRPRGRPPPRREPHGALLVGFRFWRRIALAPGLTLNLSKSGGSLSLGGRGGHFTVGSRGRRSTVGIPGTGLFYTQVSRSGRSRLGRRGGSKERTRPQRSADRLTLGFFRRLITPEGEEGFVDGCRELALGNEADAVAPLRRAAHLADGAFLGGVLALKGERFEEAAERFSTALGQPGELGRLFDRYGIDAWVELPVTDELSVSVEADRRGVLLCLTEADQHLGRWPEALQCLRRLRKLAPDDVLVKLSLADLLLEHRTGDRATARRVVELATGVKNESAVHAALLLYKARALRVLGLAEAAAETLTAALRRKKDRSEELLCALRYERALAYREQGQAQRSRSDLQRLYAQDPGYEDVASRLGLGPET